jgi:hypothetical protein
VTVKLSTTLDKLKTSISNEESKEVIQRFFDFMKKIGTSERYQNNNLKEFGNVKPQFRGAGLEVQTFYQKGSYCLKLYLLIKK